ncbi:hypothetical protein CANTEDRAFT_114174 [Yamadazyma tenuis ATCC 10573]|uniref:Altered inheritance of mitochondria protein 32 n=1 Tax=Candida tenuis (strain ATCC 10573 / BCRC 21748 / CBS 615 / JCM 9827 / NBRC 10315 / NRRL Y-1498 / VKM Y-70) TaxID=590646 RepID=G3B3E1_CANTC|nr:uncharacterized protein CANTEDRAFT_114174 [Yamadazyma tenuis ATCC 10573]EGV64382.1 hypothetical protein CANTEDRAFT_114174 [Yamadazyma tenuis ATCC 10573]
MLSRFKFVDRCPKPTVDTGCTFCRPALPLPIKQGPLHNTAASPWKHVLILSHGYRTIFDVPSNIYNVPGTAQKLRQLGSSRSPDFPVLISHVFFSNYREVPSKPENEVVYLYPDNLRIEFDRRHLQQFNDKYLLPANHQPAQPVYNPFQKPVPTVPHSAKVDSDSEPSPIDSSVFLVCGHNTRDERCGILAPPIVEELQKVGKETDIFGYITHVGGHAYAGNMIIYPEGIWYGRIVPEHVQGVVEAYGMGHVIRDLYRGPV